MPHLDLERSDRLWYRPDFPFTRHLERHAAAIRDEALALAPDDFEDWPDRAAYRGVWRTFLLLRETEIVDSGAACPRTADAVECVPGVLAARLSVLLPGTHVLPRADRGGDRLRCHLALRTNPRARLRFGAVDVPWHAGRCLVFDAAARHEAVNLGPEPCVILVLDLEREGMEHAVPGRASG